MNQENLPNYGIDYEKGLKNCIGNQVLYKKILTMFLNDPCFSRTKAAFQSGNRKEMFSCMHEMKGISGNAALTELYAACVPLVELLRTERGNPEEIQALFSATEKAYVNACKGISEYLECYDTIDR